jgi:hypothetical protein
MHRQKRGWQQIAQRGGNPSDEGKQRNLNRQDKADLLYKEDAVKQIRVVLEGRQCRGSISHKSGESQLFV